MIQRHSNQAMWVKCFKKCIYLAIEEAYTMFTKSTRCFRLLLGIIFIFSIGCKNKKEVATEESELKTEVETLEVISKGKIVTSSGDGLNFCYYLPTSTGNNRSALIFFDPHGKGQVPVEKYRMLAEEFQVILVGSNDIKNGMSMEETEEICRKLMNLSVQKLGADPSQLSLAGFSGGAKVALFNGINQPGIHSIVACGAALPAESISSAPPVLGIAGWKDMNYSEVISFIQSISAGSTSHALIEWRGKHEWPDSTTFRHAFYWALLSGNSNAAVLEKLKTETEIRLHSETSAIIKKQLIDEFSALSKGTNAENQFRSVSQKIEDSQELKKEEKRRTADLNREEKEKRGLQEAFSTRGVDWWKTKISTLRAENTAINDRLLAYISLASYSFANRALSSSDPFALRSILDIYRWADPENSEHAFLRAKMFMLFGQKDSAKVSLKEALKLGADTERIATEFPEEMWKQ